MLVKSLEFKNALGQKIKIIEIPVVDKNSRYYFMIQVRLKIFISGLYQKHQVKRCYSFSEYLKRKLSWPDYVDLYHIHDFKSNA